MKQEVFIPRGVIDDIYHLGTSAYPNEGCGVLFGNSETITELVTLPNLEKEDSACYFRLDPWSVYQMEREAEKIGGEIIGFCHSHADHEAILSLTDTEYMIPGMLSVIVSVCAGIPREIRAYRKSDEGEIRKLKILTGSSDQ